MLEFLLRDINREKRDVVVKMIVRVDVCLYEIIEVSTFMRNKVLRVLVSETFTTDILEVKKGRLIWNLDDITPNTVVVK